MTRLEVQQRRSVYDKISWALFSEKDLIHIGVKVILVPQSRPYARNDLVTAILTENCNVCNGLQVKRSFLKYL